MATPRHDRTANLLGALALVTSDAVRSVTDRAARHTDAGPAALASLFASPDGRSIDELRRMVGLTPSGGVRLVDRLVAAGLAERRAAPDRRSVIVTLTPSGRRAGRAVLGARAKALDRILHPLSTDERTLFEQLAEKLIGAHAVERLAERANGETPAGGWTCRLCDQQACGRDRGHCPAANAAASVGGERGTT